MVVCGEGGDVFMVPTHQGQKMPKQPTYKDPGEEEEQKKKKNKMRFSKRRRANTKFKWILYVE